MSLQHSQKLDIVAYRPQTHHLVHIEPSMDTDSWSKRETRYEKKFAAGRKHIPTLFPGIDLPPTPEQIAVFAFASTVHRKTVGGGQVLLLPDLLGAVFARVGKMRLIKEMVPEHLPILRSFQFVAEYRKSVNNALMAHP